MRLCSSLFNLGAKTRQKVNKHPEAAAASSSSATVWVMETWKTMTMAQAHL
jgi:hypothetical protein